jgi:hypothetical protein
VDAEAELHARIADLYEIDGRDLAHILSTFPLVDAELKDAAARAFSAVSSAI